MDEKIKIRSKALKKRNGLSAKARAVKDRKVADNLESLDLFKKAHHILFYYSVKGEADTRRLIERHLDSKQLYLPVIRGKSHFQAVPVKAPLNVRSGYENVPEPIDEEPSSVYDDKIELIITPGVAFDRKGNRIGMGKGYYDRYFAQNHFALKIALAYEEQVLDYVPKDLYDVTVDLIVTDQNIYRCHS
ncbi:5-formyltetrahydrofolate cyclo-ligase [Candidatus Peregrinibacteria bacterium]|nr:5-formyltetrahydrofolate cyclo-ligase [Candidatus Peregrinibacteria bacterium]